MKYKLITQSKKLLADTLTPVNSYVKVRDVFAGSILLESSDYHGHENSLSFICCDPIASFQVKDDMIEMSFPDKTKTREAITAQGQVIRRLDEFRQSFEADPDQKYFSAGMFGYITYDAVRFFEDVTITRSEKRIPDILYKVYRFVIVVDHFSNELNLFEHRSENDAGKGMDVEKLQKIIYSNRFSTFSFQSSGKEESNVSDPVFITIAEAALTHCLPHAVFPIS